MSGRLLSLLAMLWILAGCSSSGQAPVSERSLESQRQLALVKSQPPADGYYQVQRGDTLYSIAFRYGLDFRAMARANHIDSNYRIYPGQRLKLAEKSADVSSKSVVRPESKLKPQPSTPTSPTTSADKRTSPPASAQAPAPQATSQKLSAAKTTAAAPSKDSAKGAAKPLRWRWPSEGQVIGRFTSRGKVNKGIDIAGRQGESVHAAEAGQVVYAGSGLLGYGNLIIINHNEQFLSAYAHNSRLFVREKQQVRAGQKIAEIGRSGTTRPMLHFEIRKDGKPVNPLYYLPKR